MSELQDALDSLVDINNEWDPIVKAAKRVANGTKIRYCPWHQSRMPYGAERCQVANDLACAPGEYLLIIDPPEET